MRGQLYLEDGDFARLPQILCEPDDVEPSGTGRRGGPAARVLKVIGNESYEVIVEARKKKRQLAFVTMFKRKASKKKRS